MDEVLEHILWLFGSRYGEPQLVIASPGRINIIGEHVDYNDGYVMPAAIDRYIWGAFSISNGETHIFAANLGREISFDINQVDTCDFSGWNAYVLGVIREMQRRGVGIRNFNLVFGGNIPIGSGLSSSAALENCIAYGLSSLFDLGFDRKDLIFISQKAEHNYAGVQCGIMDQFASMFGHRNNAIFLDTKTLEYEYLELDMKEWEFVLVNSNVKHSLVSSEYNKRREQCSEGLEIVKQHFRQVQSFRDITVDMLGDIEQLISDINFKRVKYVVEEIDRTQRAKDAIKQGKWQELGQLLTKTHEGLRDLYGVSCPELDLLVDKALQHPGVTGSRMMGGGFGGCTINLVRKDQIEDFSGYIIHEFYNNFTLHADVYRLEIVDGTGVVEL